MKKLVSVVLLILCSALVLCACSFNGASGNNSHPDYTDNTVIATVNGENVYKAEYDFFYVLYTAQFNDYYGEDWEAMEIDEDGTTAGVYMSDQALDSTVMYKLQSQKAIDYGIKLEDCQEEFDKQKQAFIANFGTNDDYKEQFLDLYGVEDAAVDTVFGWTVLSTKLSETLFPVSDEDIDNYLADNGYIRARHFLIMTSDDVSEDDARSAAQAGIDRINAGEDFVAVAQELNEDPGEDVEVGYIFKEGDMVTEFYEAALALGENEYSQTPVQSSYGFHVIQRLPLSVADLDEDTRYDYAYEITGDSYTEKVHEWEDESEIVYVDEVVDALAERNVVIVDEASDFDVEYVDEQPVDEAVSEDESTQTEAE